VPSSWPPTGDGNEWTIATIAARVYAAAMNGDYIFGGLVVLAGLAWLLAGCERLIHQSGPGLVLPFVAGKEFRSPVAAAISSLFTGLGVVMVGVSRFVVVDVPYMVATFAIVILGLALAMVKESHDRRGEASRGRNPARDRHG
jgi:hypothetical protein